MIIINQKESECALVMKELKFFKYDSEKNIIILPTMGGEYFWNILKENTDYKLQKHVIIPLYRIIDNKNHLISIGDKNKVYKKYDRLVSGNLLKSGDVIGVRRGLYEHYGIYIGNNKVIHYAPKFSDKLGDSKENSIHIADISHFLGESKNLFVLEFPEEHEEPIKINEQTLQFGLMDLIKVINTPKREFDKHIAKTLQDYHLYTPEETIERAKSRIGESNYNLLYNNCEHFAIWAKTNIKESKQVGKVIGYTPAYIISCVSEIPNIIKKQLE